MRIAVIALSLVLSPVAQGESCCKIAPSSLTPTQQALDADVVVLGTVGEVDPDVATVEQHRGGGKITHMIVTIRIRESLRGAKGVTHLRVGFVPMAQSYTQDELGLPFGESRVWQGGVNLLPGQNACFFLQKHPSADFYVPVPRGYPLDNGRLGYTAEMEQVRKITRALERPLEALRAKEAGDRQFAACALVHRYRQPVRNSGGGMQVEEAVSAEESRLILEALGGMKWGDTPFDLHGALSLQNVFSQLQIADKDGWRPPAQSGNEDYNTVLTEAAAKWLKANAGTYTVRRLVNSSAKQ
jgi:hypothetical protein